MGGLFGGGGGGTVVNEAPKPLIVRHINAPGYISDTTGDPQNLSINVQRQPIIDQLLGQFRANANTAADQFAGLRAGVNDATNGLKASQLQALENSRLNAIGTLKENLAKRRVLGSSFANAALSQANLGYGQAASQIGANADLQNLAINSELISQENQQRQSAITQDLNQLNFEAGIAGGINSSAQGALNQAAQIAAENERMNAQLAVQQQQNSGSFFGTLLGLGLGLFGGASSIATGASLSPASIGSVPMTQGLSLAAWA